ncbi:MAG: efflux transporter outer membrane subunit [Burkholderiaceae bacterium]
MPFLMRLRIFGGLISAAGLVACTAVGPNFETPASSPPGGWPDRSARPAEPPDHEGARVSALDTQSDPDPRWWKTFNDAVLEELIEKAVKGNLDLKAAVQRIISARAQVQEARAQGLPHLDGNARYTREQLGAKGLLEEQGSSFGSLTSSPTAQSIEKEIEQPVSLFQWGFDASWELDLFGRVRRTTEAAEAQNQSAIESRNDALVSLEAEVAQTYLQLRGAQVLRDLTQRQIDDAREIFRLTDSRNRYGLASRTDVESARAQLSAVEANLPQYENQITAAGNALAVLTGEIPGSLDAMLESHDGVPPVPSVVPVGVPASLARRRPDVRMAEANLHAATAETGVAIAGLFPDISLSAQDGFRAFKPRYLTRWDNNFWSLAPSISLPIFQGGALEANVRSAKAQQEGALLAYEKAVLTALQDVDNALSAYANDQSRRDAIQTAVLANRGTLDFAQDGYRHGLTSFVTVLNAEQQLEQEEAQLAQLNAQVSIDLVALYKSLGGGWENDAKGPIPALGSIGDAGVAP